MKTLAAAFAVVLLTACSSFKLGTVAYFAYGQFGTLTVGPKAADVPAVPTPPASAAK